jgi:hypothetical protein
MSGGYYVNGVNMDTIFQEGSYVATTNGGFKKNGSNITYTAAGSEGVTASTTYFRLLNSDLNTLFRQKTSFTTTAGVSDYSYTYNSGTNTTVISFTAVKTVSITFLKSMTIKYLIVGGGGGGGTNLGSGGGGGGVLYNASYGVTATTYNITVGAGGNASSSDTTFAGTNGSDSVFHNITAKGGGRGVGQNVVVSSPNVGGSGGGGSRYGTTGANGTASQGNKGGNYSETGSTYSAGGGGGAGTAGGDGTTNKGGNGGNGISIDITGTAVYYGG